jgi:hypothetical protein
MVESLKRSVARLEPPICQHCNLTMIWYRSIRASEHDRIIHYFQCANCNRIEEKSSKIKIEGNGDGPPSSASRLRRSKNVATGAQSRHG